MKPQLPSLFAPGIEPYILGSIRPYLTPPSCRILQLLHRVLALLLSVARLRRDLGLGAIEG